MPREALSPALLASQRSLIESMPFPVFIRGADGHYLACNRLFQEFIGRGEGQVVGLCAADLTSPDLAELYEQQNAEVWEQRRPLIHDASVVRADGALRQVRFHRSILHDNAGEAVGIIGVLEDVTEERQAVSALAESEARFARLCELSSEGVILHAYGTIIDVNPALLRMTGWTRQALIGRHYSVLLSEGGQEVARRHVDERSAEPYRADLLRADGSRFPAEIRGRAISYQDRDVRVTTIRDITERLAAEKAMREGELLYRQMFENNRVVKLLIDPATGQIVDANQAAANFYGWSIDELRLMNITHINALPADQVKAEMELARTERRTFFRFRHRLASGEVRRVEVFSGPCTFHSRSLLHSIIVDVTEREEALAELRRKSSALELSNADLQQFAYVASHDLQEPLRSVVSYLQLLERRYRGHIDADADEFIGYAVDAAKRMGSLIQDLLTYSRVDAQDTGLEPVDCGMVLTATLANLHGLLEAMEAKVEVESLPRVLGDAPQLSSVFQNLIGNAVKYRHRDRAPVIRISAEPGEAGEWVFTVADNGIGIAPEYHDRVFKIFQRLHTQTEYPGTGIGLALVRRIISRHGGRIWIDTDGDEGTAFRFTLREA
jgi:PAS domain S-box-containing protein